MNKLRFLSSVFAILALVSTTMLACAGKPTQAPTATPSLPAVPMPPTLITPANESIISGLAINMEWNPSAGATSYGLQIATDPIFTKLIMEKTGISNANYELTSGLNWKSSYYWRVNAANASGTSPWSASWKFNTPIFQLGKIVFTSYRDSNFEIYIMNADGSNQTRLTNNPANDNWPSWSNDGTKIAFCSNRDGNLEVYVMNVDGSNQTRLTNNPAWDWVPAWAPDGSRIAFTFNTISSTERAGTADIYVMNTDGSNRAKLTQNPTDDAYPTWSPDGTKITFSSDRDGHPEIYIMNADGSNQTRLTTTAPGVVNARASWSPDDTRIAFHSNRDGNYEIYVMNADGSNQTRLTNNPAEDSQPSWR